MPAKVRIYPVSGNPIVSIGLSCDDIALKIDVTISLHALRRGGCLFQFGIHRNVNRLRDRVAVEGEMQKLD